MGAVFLVRHGQASFGAAEYDQLSDLGARQAEIVGAALVARGVGADAFVARGSMRRHAQTTEGCLRAMGMAEVAVAVESGWDEYDHEDVLAGYEPRYRQKEALAQDLARHDDPRAAFQSIFARATDRWVSGAHDGEYGESFGAFRQRVARAFEALQVGLGKGRSAVIVTSGGPIAVLAGSLLGVPETRQLALGWTLANAGITKLLVRPGAATLSTLNEHAHFEGAGRALLTYR